MKKNQSCLLPEKTDTESFPTQLEIQNSKKELKINEKKFNHCKAPRINQLLMDIKRIQRVKMK